MKPSHAERMLRLLATSLVACLPLLPASCASDPGRVPDPTPRSRDRLLAVGAHTFHRRTLANGLRAVAVADEGKGVSVFMVVGVGKRQETHGTTGLAHLTEHALYTGTPTTAAGEHDRRIQEMGGESNAFTRTDYTLYYDHQIPPERLQEALRMEADRLMNLRFDEPAFLHERQRLKDEEARTFQPAMAREEQLEAFVYQVHPYRHGELDRDGHTIAPIIPMDVVRRFYELYYTPGNTAVVVVGQLEPTKALDAIEAAFGALPPRPAPPGVPAEPEPTEARRTVLDSTLGRDRVEFVWLVPALGHPDRAPLQVLLQWLQQQTTTSGGPVFASLGDRVDAEMFRVAATGTQAEAELLQLLDRTLQSGPDEGEVAEAVASLADDYSGLSLRGRPYFALAGTFGVYEVLGHADALAGHESAVRKVRRDDVLRAARKYLVPHRRVTVVFQGNGEEAEDFDLPDDAKELARIAEDSSQSGQLDRAIAAYGKLLERKPDRMNTVIYLASRGQIHMEREDFDAAIDDFEAALAVVDYPAVRELLKDAEARKASGGSTPGTPEAEKPAAAAPPPAAPTMAERLAEARHELEAWRGLSFLQEVVPEYVEERDDKLAGWYEPERKRLVVVEGKDERFTRGTLLHELFHALQDQHFDLAELQQTAAGMDQSRAITGLIEGEAMLAVSELMDYDFEQHAHLEAAGPVDRERFEKIYQYGAGLRFVRALRERGGWEAVAEAYRNPPVSSSEILHPERYPLPPRDSEPTLPLPAGVEILEQDAHGEFELLWELAQAEAYRSAAASLAALPDADVYRRVKFPDGHEEEIWDLDFAGNKIAEQFLEAATASLKDQRWYLTREGRQVRMIRTL